MFGFFREVFDPVSLGQFKVHCLGTNMFGLKVAAKVAS